MIHKRVRTPPREASPRRRHQRPHPSFAAKLASMRIRLCPMVQISTGNIHPAFPSTILNFWLLTEDQLDSLAEYYHQRFPCEYTLSYPCPVTWDASLPLPEKRRKIGKFIGLRGCDSPIVMKTEEEIMEEVRKNAMAEDESRWMNKSNPRYPGRPW